MRFVYLCTNYKVYYIAFHKYLRQFARGVAAKLVGVFAALEYLKSFVQRKRAFGNKLGAVHLRFRRYIRPEVGEIDFGLTPVTKISSNLTTSCELQGTGLKI